MSRKITKDMATHLFKYVTKVNVKYNPFDGRTTSAREVLTQVRASRFSKVNPNLKIVPDIVSTIDPPLIDFQFVDGSQKSFDSQGYHAKEILDEVYQYLTNLDMEYQLADKNIDDLQ